MKNLPAILLLVIGVALLVYGFNHMDSTESKIRDFFGQEDKTGMIAIVIGAIMAIAGAFLLLRKK